MSQTIKEYYIYKSIYLTLLQTGIILFFVSTSHLNTQIQNSQSVIQVEWRGLGRVFGVRAMHAEVVSGTPPFAVGDRVRVRAAVTQPRYKWGCIDHTSVGTVTCKYFLNDIFGDNRPFILNFLVNRLKQSKKLQLCWLQQLCFYCNKNLKNILPFLAISSNGRDLTVDFPQQPGWTGQVSEMELVTDQCKLSIIQITTFQITTFTRHPVASPIYS